MIIAACAAIGAVVVPDEQVRTPIWFFFFLVLAVCARFSWSHPKAPRSIRGWLGIAATAAVWGGIILAISGAVRSAVLQRQPRAGNVT
ncbi:MAG: hypothetical protein K2X55_31195 [Burkholderiaceae bacterium]|nr:hypothetical protein [Burkholderiaceae bacterium]